MALSCCPLLAANTLTVSVVSSSEGKAQLVLRGGHDSLSPALREILSGQKAFKRGCSLVITCQEKRCSLCDFMRSGDRDPSKFNMACYCQDLQPDIVIAGPILAARQTRAGAAAPDQSTLDNLLAHSAHMRANHGADPAAVSLKLVEEYSTAKGAVKLHGHLDWQVPGGFLC